MDGSTVASSTHPLNNRKVRHKRDGWVGHVEVNDEAYTGGSSSVGWMRLSLAIIMDSHHNDKGEYFEDPWVESLDELEFLDV